MGFKQRGYQRDVAIELVRDYKLFAIACEGSVREPEYFGVFEYLSKKIKVDVIEEHLNSETESNSKSTKSSPKWVLDKAISYISEKNLLEEDELWFVLDVDRWSIDQIRELSNFCDEHLNWNLVLSNPCFEIWLFFHKSAKIKDSKSETCKEFKFEISKFDKPGYDKLSYIKNVMTAIENSKLNDSEVNHFFPKEKESKVYLLVESLIKSCSKKDFKEFIETTIPNLIAKRKDKIKIKKITEINKNEII